ncbi:SNF2 domain-containing protein [Actinidia rufa]|uniref:SNF2 domain-containing protein n=1 Tax=Actinidia rufa TaxID=165716 RepID=A0A7J0F395_9ERIC|nr:SNF2 domain-containing protein [Actinidia rufa]
MDRWLAFTCSTWLRYLNYLCVLGLDLKTSDTLGYTSGYLAVLVPWLATKASSVLVAVLASLVVVVHAPFLMLGSLGSFSVFLVIFYEQDWNPQVDKQALQRAHRIGQMNHVMSINLVTGHTVEEVIMRRADKKLQLSHNVVGEDLMDQEGKEFGGAAAGDLRSAIFGLHMFDPTDTNIEQPDEINVSELNAMAEKVLALRYKQQSAKDDTEFEINPMDQLTGHDFVKKDPTYVAYAGFNEASYLSWIEKFKEALQSNNSPTLDLENRRNLLEVQQRAEAARKKAEEKKLFKWEALGYHSLSVKDPIVPLNEDIMSDSGSVQFVYGDCTHPSKICPADPAIIFSCVDDSGYWGHGGMFDALARLSESVPSAYHLASEFKDLHLGDLHLIEIKGLGVAARHADALYVLHEILEFCGVKVRDEGFTAMLCLSQIELSWAKDRDEQTKSGDPPQWVALSIVQSYNPKRKIPRSSISIPHLERCLSKAAFSAVQNSGI